MPNLKLNCNWSKVPTQVNLEAAQVNTAQLTLTFHHVDNSIIWCCLPGTSYKNQTLLIFSLSFQHFTPSSFWGLPYICLNCKNSSLVHLNNDRKSRLILIVFAALFIFPCCKNARPVKFTVEWGSALWCPLYIPRIVVKLKFHLGARVAAYTTPIKWTVLLFTNQP